MVIRTQPARQREFSLVAPQHWQPGCICVTCSRDGAARRGNMRLIADFVFLVLFLVFLAGWLIAFLAFHIAGGIHILLALAIIWLIIHFARRRHAV